VRGCTLFSQTCEAEAILASIAPDGPRTSSEKFAYIGAIRSYRAAICQQR
jgi:hypothetical protein